jgi:hypothetical protein
MYTQASFRSPCEIVRALTNHAPPYEWREVSQSGSSLASLVHPLQTIEDALIREAKHRVDAKPSYATREKLHLDIRAQLNASGFCLPEIINRNTNNLMRLITRRIMQAYVDGGAVSITGKRNK